MQHVTSSETLTGFAHYLVTSSLIEQTQASEAVIASAEHNVPLIAYMVSQGLIEAKKIATVAADYFSIPLVEANQCDIRQIPRDLLNLPMVESRHALPLQRNNERLTLAVVDPTIPEINELTFLTGLKTDIVLMSAMQLRQLIDNIVLQQDTSVTFSEDQQNPAVEFIDKIIADAIRNKASDIHFEPYEAYYRVRFRQDGVLYEMAKPPKNLADNIVARLKVMSDLDISERRVPQDGRFQIEAGKNHYVDFRLSTCPTLFGEKIVIRLLDNSATELDIDALGMTDSQKEQFLHAINHSQGIILVTGPTGSGKTVTQYTALNILNEPTKNISTVEDPVEFNLAGINQVTVNRKTGMTFARALRAFLRQDPDIIMVGEIRDTETAEIAVKAAQTGHLVLSTLHTNSAPETLIRLENMGIASYNIASAVILIVAQRLVRKLCQHCKEPVKLTQAELIKEGFSKAELSKLTIYAPKGCDNCKQGYAGRLGIYEVMPISRKMGELIMQGGNAMDIAKLANTEGVDNLRQSGLNAVRNGDTSLHELNAVITR